MPKTQIVSGNGCNILPTQGGGPRTVRLFWQVMLREHTPFAGIGIGLSYADCLECHGSGIVLDSRGYQAVQRSVCQPGSG